MPTKVYLISQLNKLLFSFFTAAEPKKKKKKKKATDELTKKAKVIKPDATSKTANKSSTVVSPDLSEAILGTGSNKNTMKVC